jgi:predicted  nucleic acid-binding Zn-ribbon protein
MNSLNLTLDLVGAIGLGFFIGFAYAKLGLSEKYETTIKSLKDLINIKDTDLMLIQKDLQSEITKTRQLKKELNDKVEKYHSLESNIKKLETTLKTKNKEIKELETLLLEIQNDFTTLSKELHIQRKLNNSQREKFKKKIDELTQKANDLYMVKGTEELKHAKAIFNKLREESLNNI